VKSSTSLHAYADIVGYSRLNATQQALSQEQLVRYLNSSMLDAGVRPDSVLKQNEGDACLLTFPVDSDVAFVLAAMPRSLSAHLQERNKDAAPHAQLRMRLSFVVGPSSPGITGQTGNPPVAASRLCNSAAFREIMAAAADACLGVIVDEFVYGSYVQQGFRADLEPDEYRPLQVSEKEYRANAWIRLIGRQPQRGPRSRKCAETTRAPVRGARSSEQAHEPAPAERASHKWRWLLNDGTTRIIAAAIVGGLGLIGVGLPFMLNAHTRDPNPVHRPKSPSEAAPRTGPPTLDPAGTQPTSITITEYGDWGPGVAVYANNFAAASDAPVIPLNQKVEVSCYAPNMSGISSINKFYLITSKPWKGTYASANEFTNNGPLDTASDPSIDPRVRPCLTS
jgi:hypothetical protein